MHGDDGKVRVIEIAMPKIRGQADYHCLDSTDGSLRLLAVIYAAWLPPDALDVVGSVAREQQDSDLR